MLRKYCFEFLHLSLFYPTICFVLMIFKLYFHSVSGTLMILKFVNMLCMVYDHSSPKNADLILCYL